ncbi:MAG: hypothetical protein KBC96_13080 [Armatimonadetes bacterium]|nr:hypothetical protein [Armatimonadota bacterium]
MRLTRDAYAREVWKVIETLNEGEQPLVCPHEGCEKPLDVSAPSLHTGTTVSCPEHGVIFRE